MLTTLVFLDIDRGRSSLIRYVRQIS